MKLRGDFVNADELDVIETDDDDFHVAGLGLEGRFDFSTSSARLDRPTHEDSVSPALTQVWRMKRRRQQRSGRQRRQRCR